MHLGRIIAAVFRTICIFDLHISEKSSNFAPDLVGSILERTRALAKNATVREDYYG